MSGNVMMFPDTVEEFMESYKIVDSEQVYTNGDELVPIFRMQQWFDHVKNSRPDDLRPVGKWIRLATTDICPFCKWETGKRGIATNYCPNCGAKMEVTAE